MKPLTRVACTLVATLAPLAFGGVAAADPSGGPPALGAPGSPAPAKSAGQGVAVLAMPGARDEAFTLARAVYGSRLRPASLDEVRARVLAGDPPPANASRELRELAEVRASVRGDDAASRKLLAGIGREVGAQALLVVRIEETKAAEPEPAAADAGAAPAESPADAGAAVAPEPARTAPKKLVLARLLLVDGAELDPAQYSPDPEGGWKGTIASLERRFPAPDRVTPSPAATQAVPAQLPVGEEKSRPFYTSGWFWAALGGAALLGGAFYVASRDTASDSIQIQMRVPR